MWAFRLRQELLFKFRIPHGANADGQMNELLVVITSLL